MSMLIATFAGLAVLMIMFANAWIIAGRED